MTSQNVTLYTLIAVLSVSTLPACTTVDFQSMSGDSSPVTQSASVTTNVVERSVAQLEASFTDRGFGANVEMSGMARATEILMHGIKKISGTPVGASYADSEPSLDTISSDILLAETFIDKTARAGLVYLETAPLTDDLADELSQLESALLRSERAKTGFDRALERFDNDDVDLTPFEARMTSLSDSIDGLRGVTDDYGIRVRERRLQRREGTGAAS